MAAGLFVALATPARSQGALTVSGPTILVDGRPTFLTGISLFDALGPAAPRDADLDALADWGVNTVRVWAHWHEAIYQADGTLSSAGRERLVALARRMQAKRLTLELVLLRPGQLPKQPFAVFASEAARASAVDAIARAMLPFRDVLFDLYNEHDHPDGPITHVAARALRDRVKEIDPTRIVTISSTEYHLMSNAGAIDEGALRGEAGDGPDSVAVDVLAPHLPRTDDWAAATTRRVQALRAALGRSGSRAPIYLNEERRARPDAAIAAAAYGRARAAAQAAGAAGWIFHTSAGFDLRAKPFTDALTAEERAGLAALRGR